MIYITYACTSLSGYSYRFIELAEKKLSSCCIQMLSNAFNSIPLETFFSLSIFTTSQGQYDDSQEMKLRYYH
jgi:hypothetical protein